MSFLQASVGRRRDRWIIVLERNAERVAHLEHPIVGDRLERLGESTDRGQLRRREDPGRWSGSRAEQRVGLSDRYVLARPATAAGEAPAIGSVDDGFVEVTRLAGIETIDVASVNIGENRISRSGSDERLPVRREQRNRERLKTGASKLTRNASAVGASCGLTAVESLQPATTIWLPQAARMCISSLDLVAYG